MKYLLFLLCFLFGGGLVTHAASPPSISVTSATMLEGNSGTHTMTLQVKLSQASKVPLKVEVLTSSETALSSEDYVSKYQILTFAAGVLVKNFTIDIVGDTKFEPDEYFVILASAKGYSSKNPAATCVIRNDDSRATPTPRPTAKPTPRPTATPKPRPTPTATLKPRPTSTPKPTPKPTATTTPQPSATPAPTFTPQPTATATSAPTATPEPTAMATPSPTATPEPPSTLIKGKFNLRGMVNGVKGLYVMNADGSNRTLIDPELNAGFWSPDGTNILARADIYTLCVVTVSDKRITRIPAPQGYLTSFGWSPDGAKIVMTTRAQNGDEFERIYVSDVNGENRRCVGENMHIFTWSWSADSKHLAFNSQLNNGKFQIFVFDADQEQTVTVSDSSRAEFAGNWSPDSKRLLFKSAPNTDSGTLGSICSMDADGNNRKVISSGWPELGTVRWSPNGKKIAFSNEDYNLHPGYDSLYVIDADGTHIVDLSQHSATAGNIKWSADSQKILTAMPSKPIYMWDADGTKGILFQTPDFPVALNPQWSPDGNKVAWRGVGTREISPTAPLYVANPDGTGIVNVAEGMQLESESFFWTSGSVPPPSGASPARGPSSAPSS